MESQNYSETTTQYTTILYLKPEQKEEEKAIKAEKKKLKPNKQVVWAEDTIDNENMNRLKSKICCIYHKPKNTEDPNSSSTCTSDDSGNDLERSRETKKNHKNRCSKHKRKDVKEQK